MAAMRTVLGLVVLAVFSAPTAVRADKCMGAKLMAVGKKEAGLLACESKVAARNDTSGLAACRSKVMAKFSAAFPKAGNCAGDETRCEDVAEHCDSAMSAFLTDTFPSKCEAAKRKAAGKLASGELGCYAKAASKGAALDTGCITKAQGKFGTALSKAGTCPDSGSPRAAIEQDCVRPAVTTNGGGMVAAVCPTTTTTTSSTTTTTTTTATTTTTLPACGNSFFFPTCGGTCPVGDVCQATGVVSEFGGTAELQECGCVPSNALCGGGNGCSSGTCPAAYPVCTIEINLAIGCRASCCKPLGSTCATDADCCLAGGVCDLTSHICELPPFL